MMFKTAVSLHVLMAQMKSNNAFALFSLSPRGQKTTRHEYCSRTKTPTPFSTQTSAQYSFSRSNWKPIVTRLQSTKSDTTPPLPDTSDPYIILNLKPTADKKEMKRAYKRMALKYHPDVRTTSSSTEEERKRANDDFARINSAYAFLSGKSDERPASTESEKKNGRGGASAGSYGYTPPHRRTSADRKSYATDWQDYMPKYDESEYDTNGDSFGAIFSDLFAATASSGVGGASILNDFISFLEGNFPSVGTAQQTEEDLILESLLRTGSLDEIKDEFDDAKLLVKQLEQKEIALDSELLEVVKEKEALGMTGGGTYMEDMRLEERKREVEARKEVVGDYLERARMRQLKLRKRYEELRVEGSGRPHDSNRSTGRGADWGSSNSSNRNGEPSSSAYTSTSGAYSSGTSNSSQSDNDDSWKRESFGSNRRRRGSGRSRSSPRTASRGTSSQSMNDEKNYSEQSTGSAGSRAYARTGSPSSSVPSPPPRSSPTTTSSQNQANLPPHRRLSSRYEQVQEDKRRLREIKVDEEIDKMKKELGL